MQRVEVLRSGFVELHIDAQALTPIGEIPAADLLVFRGDDVRLRTCLIESLARLGEFDLLEAFRAFEDYRQPSLLDPRGYE